MPMDANYDIYESPQLFVLGTVTELTSGKDPGGTPDGMGFHGRPVVGTSAA